MKAYENGNPAYFATPPVNLIHAYHESLLQILKEPLEERFKRNHEASQRIKDAATKLGLKQIALDPAFAANGMTTVRFFIQTYRTSGINDLNALHISCIIRMVSVLRTSCPVLRNTGSPLLEGCIPPSKVRTNPFISATRPKIDWKLLARITDKYFRIGCVQSVSIVLQLLTSILSDIWV